MYIAKLFGVGTALAVLALAAGSIGTAQKVITVCPSGCDFNFHSGGHRRSPRRQHDPSQGRDVHREPNDHQAPQLGGRGTG